MKHGVIKLYTSVSDQPTDNIKLHIRRQLVLRQFYHIVRPSGVEEICAVCAEGQFRMKVFKGSMGLNFL